MTPIGIVPGTPYLTPIPSSEKLQRPDTGLKAPPALGGSAMVVRLTGRQIFAVNGTAPARHDRRAEPGLSTSEMIQKDMKIL